MASRAVSPVEKSSPPAKTAVPSLRAVRKPAKTEQSVVVTQLHDAVDLATKTGLLSGPRDLVVRARVPAKLVSEAKRKSGITSDSKLLEAALASIATMDNYVDWLNAHSGTVTMDIDFDL